MRCAYLNGATQVSAGDLFGKLIEPWVKLPPKNFIPKKELAADDFTFELPNYKFKNTDYNYYIDEEAQKYIEQMLDEIFRGMLNIHLDTILPRMPKEYRGVNIKQAIYDYCYSYNISFEHVNYEALKKSYYRYREAKKEKKISSQFVPILSLFL